jgi:hypothetical protein
MLSHYRRLLRLRRDQPVLRIGEIELLDAPEQVVRWRRHLPDDDPLVGDGRVREVEVAVNFAAHAVPDAVRAGTVLGGTRASSHFPDGRGDTTLEPDEARIVAPG